MYKSLKSMLNIPVVVKPFDKRDGANNKAYKSNVNSLCYAEGKTTKVVNSSGEEVVSQLQLYFDNDTPIGMYDLVIFNGKEYPIKAIGTFYDKGTIDLQVVYL